MHSTNANPAPEYVDCDTPVSASGSVRVTAGETIALLMHASRKNRAWLADFAEETIVVSQDLYEVLVAYKRLALEERASAA
ncbi:MAG: hypothetical protein ACE361_12720 [Aureliella sp.]